MPLPPAPRALAMTAGRRAAAAEASATSLRKTLLLMLAQDQGLTLVHVTAQLVHLRDTSIGNVGLYGGQSQVKLSGNGNEWKPLPRRRRWGQFS